MSRLAAIPLLILAAQLPAGETAVPRRPVEANKPFDGVAWQNARAEAELLCAVRTLDLAIRKAPSSPAAAKARAAQAAMGFEPLPLGEWSDMSPRYAAFLRRNDAGKLYMPRLNEIKWPKSDEEARRQEEDWHRFVWGPPSCECQ